MSRAMLISCSRRWRSRSRSTRRALSRMFAASAARASRIWRSSLEKAAGRRESRYRTPRSSPRLMLTIDSCVFARAMAKRGTTTTARRRCATTLCAACKSMSACARSSVITGDCCLSASWMAVLLGVTLSGGKRNAPLRRASFTFSASVESFSRSRPRSASVTETA